MIHVWKINEDLDLNKEDIERTFSGFSDALLLFAEGGKGKLICKTFLKKRNDKEIILTKCTMHILKQRNENHITEKKSGS